MSSEPHTIFPAQARWEGPGTSRIPFKVYTDEDLHRKELERFFYQKHWCYVGLEAEIPHTGDFKRTAIGERSVVMVRDAEGGINVIENVCAHRGMQFCRERSGNRKELVCPYHQWNYSLKGELQGVPFRRGVKQDGKVHGGMPADFDPAEHSLNKLKVATRGGVVFASFDHGVEPLEDFLGPEILAYFDRLFDGRQLTILGYNRQRIPGNWKLMQENIKDPYHPGLLHTWFVTFGLWRADNKSELTMDARHRHAAMVSTRGQAGKAGQVTQVSSFKESMQLEDPRFLDIVPEPWWGGPTAVMMTLFPSVILQQQVNSVSTRHIQPAGHGAFDFVWTHFGFADDTEEMTQRRLRQANLFGPAGFVSADDGEVIEFSQQGFEQKPFHRALAELGGREVGNTDHMVTETLIRGMYKYWREVMEDDAPPQAEGAEMDFATYYALTQLYADYASAVDSGDWDLWPAFFTDDCSYRLQPRENHERGFPLATLSFESKGMLRDRVYGIKETLFHDPYYQRHIIGAPVVRTLDGERIHCEANYAVLRTKLSQATTVFNAGRYIDEVVRTPDGLKFAKKLVVYDSEMIPNSIIYPI